MKKLRFIPLIVAVLFSSLAFGAEAKATESITPQERVNQLETRVHEIWKMDVKELEGAEKALLKQEVKNIKKEIKEIRGLDDKVTMSVGLIIIILLLIILLS